MTSSADRGRSSGNRDSQAPGDRDRCEKEKQFRPVRAVVAMAEERVLERVRQGDDLENRDQTSACDLPERGLRNVSAPEDLPASDGPFVSTEAFGELADSARLWPLPHGA